MSERIQRTDDSVILYDDDLLDQVAAEIFSASRGSPGGVGAGRGGTSFVTVAGRDCVLRHYYRGGMIRKLSDDSFVWTGEDRTRPFREWRLLDELFGLELPVPKPMAARYSRRGFLYTADLVTERLPDVASLAVRMCSDDLTSDAWRRVGATIADFHARRVFHADLNAHNVQIDGAGRVYLLDFDRGRIRSRAGAWCGRNLQRLRRSLDKVAAEAGMRLDERDWATLLAGYAAG